MFKKSTLSNMHHRKTYLYINFQQNRVSRSVKNVHTYLFAKKIAGCINLQLRFGKMYVLIYKFLFKSE